MHINEIRVFFVRLLTFLGSILPIAFWVLLIYAFDEPCAAGITVIAALVHEGGHLLYLVMSAGGGSLSGALSGFRIRSAPRRCYGDEIRLLLAGPLSNILFALLTLPFIPSLGEYAALFALLNFATALSNLLPVRGHDGYGIIKALLDMRYAPRALYSALGTASFFITALLSFTALYLMDRCDSGYWIYALFIASLISEIRLGLKTAKNGIL